MSEQIKLGIIGGLGDVALTRKYTSLINNPNFSIATIADTYPKERLQTPEGVHELLDEIETKRLKKPVSPKVKDFLAREISEGKIQYYPVTNGIPKEVFEAVGSNGVIDISTPNKVHCNNLEQSVRGFNGHIVIEKPVVVNRKQLEILYALNQVLSGSNRVAMDAEHYSYYENVLMFLSRLPGLSANTVPGGLGKIQSLDLILEEIEGFSKERNRDTIDTTKSGGGIWLDLGPHVLSFLYSIGAKLDLKNTLAISRKANDPEIADSKYGETQMEVWGRVFPSERFADNCTYHISVGKAMSNLNKTFSINYGPGKVILDMTQKKNFIINSSGKEVDRQSADPQSDAFANMFSHLYNSIPNKKGKSKVLTPLSRSGETLGQLFDIYDISRRVG